MRATAAGRHYGEQESGTDLDFGFIMGGFPCGLAPLPRQGCKVTSYQSFQIVQRFAARPAGDAHKVRNRNLRP